MKQQKNKPTLSISVSGIKLNVIRVGASPRLKSAQVTHSSSQNIEVAHSHFTYEVFFITEGNLEIVTERGTSIYERKIVIIPPRISHYTRPNGDGCYCLLFSFEKARQSTIEQIKNKLSFGLCELELTSDIEYYIRALVRKSAQDSLASEKDSELLANLIFNDILCRLIPDQAQRDSTGSETRHIGTIETYINDNFKGKIRLSDVARQVFLSTRQVSRIIQREYNCTLSQLVIQKKLMSAQMMLKNTDLKIGEIASRVNLGSENYFYTLFKKNYGVSPRQYRIQNTTNNNK